MVERSGNATTALTIRQQRRIAPEVNASDTRFRRMKPASRVAHRRR